MMFKLHLNNSDHLSVMSRRKFVPFSQGSCTPFFLNEESHMA